MSDSLQPHGLYSPQNSPGQNTGVGSCSLLQGIFPTQRLNPGLLHCRQILYQLISGKPKIFKETDFKFKLKGKWFKKKKKRAISSSFPSMWPWVKFLISCLSSIK